MTTTLSVTALFSIKTAAEILGVGLAIARVIGLPVTSWRTGDPTRSLYKYLSEVLATLEQANSDYIKSGFLSTSTGDWLTVLAKEVYNVDRVLATLATSTVTLTNTGGSLFDFQAVGELTVKSASSGKTYHNTSFGTLSAGATVAFEVIADEAGSDSSAIANEIDTLVTGLLDVVVDSSTAAVGIDEQSDASLREQCNDTLGALSPNGPPDAYEFTVRDSTKTGVDDITRAKSSSDSPTGVVTVHIASASGAVAGASVTAAQVAVDVFATPLTVTPTVVNSTPVNTAVTVDISGMNIPAGAAATIESALGTLFSATAIEGLLATSKIESTIHNAVAEIDTLTLTIPAADVDLAVGEVITLGTVTVNEV